MNPLPTEHLPDRSDASLVLVVPSWRDRTSLSVSETAIVFARSTTWVRNRITDRSLEVSTDPAGPTAVTVASAVALMEHLARLDAEAALRGRDQRPYPRLVVDNML